MKFSDKNKKIWINILTIFAVAVMIIAGVVIVRIKGGSGTTERKDTIATDGVSEEPVPDLLTEEHKEPALESDDEGKPQDNKENTLPDKIEEEARDNRQTTAAEVSDDYLPATDPEENSGQTEASGEQEDDSSYQEISPEEKSVCSLTIQCLSILDNKDKLSVGKEEFVPESGYILSTNVEFSKGETVFDVLKRACQTYGIQIEYSYAPIYGTYYIEGINQLYEFDCGSASGWMYSVNGVAPNVGCSSYTLEENDSIVFYYTCDY